MDVNLIGLWVTTFLGIFALAAIVFAFFYKVRRTDETVTKIDKKFDKFNDDNIKFGLLIGQMKERFDSHERRYEEDKVRLDKHLDRIDEKLDELKGY